MAFTIGEIKQFIREVVREAKIAAKVDSGLLRGSIRGGYNEKRNEVVFRQLFYGVYLENSQLIEIAQRVMPKEIDWKVILIDESGRQTQVKGKTRTGRKVRRSVISNVSSSTNKIKSLISAFRTTKKERAVAAAKAKAAKEAKNGKT